MADLFGAVRTSSGRQKRWSSIPFSIGIHGLLIAAAIVGPAASMGALPNPTTILAFSLPPPQAPPERPVASRVAQRVTPMTAEATPRATPGVVVSILTAAPVVHPTLLVPPESTGMPGGTGVSAPLFGAPAPPQAVQPGGQVEIPVKIVDVPPVYPAIARQAHVSGVVIIEAVIDVDGRVRAARVLRSVPFLDQAAVEAVRQWRYRPTLLDGVPVAVVLTVTVDFALK